ncbi:uncharacterized protein LOC114532464 [Dendronephthya gigantea]|uniref:uncharacterized protein LOC114532464 n=1 Tax=Dendronephthya gigantea TaxID=151771 RepID=UPI00106A97C8|nr:uncharacterized protein LOC114532464 [Dendronephthya gigantea]
MSSDDLQTKYGDLVKRLIKEEFHDVIESRQAELRVEIEAYNAEKPRMSAVVIRDDDIIELHVGADKFTTTKSTLCQVKDSLLASMFSGRWEESVRRDKKGNIFFDYNPKYFGLILDYLRAKKIASPENPAPMPDVPNDELQNFKNFVGFLGLSGEIVPTITVPVEKFELRSPGVTLQEDGRVAVNDTSGQYKYALGKNAYQQGIVNFKLNLELFQNNNWIFIGMLRTDVLPQYQSDNSFKWPGGNGWALGANGYAYAGGVASNDSSLNGLSKQGDTVHVVLNCDEGKLSLHLPSGHQVHIEIPKSQSWRLHVNMYGANDKIRIVEVVQE